MANLMHEVDILARPSVREEAFGLAAIEASACGLPVIASGVGGVPKAPIHDKTGILLVPGDPVPPPQACTELVDRPKTRQAMGTVGRKLKRRSSTILVSNGD